jgi:hypothetical protein
LATGRSVSRPKSRSSMCRDTCRTSIRSVPTSGTRSTRNGRQALAAGLADIILHGTATWALAGLVILRRYADRDVWRLKRSRGRFTGMVIPGETIRIRHSSEDDGVVRLRC